MAVTVLEVAEHRLGYQPENGAQFAEAGFAILGGCGCCGATIAAYNAHPSKSGFWKCGDCIGEDGWNDADTCDFDLRQAEWKAEQDKDGEGPY